MKTLSFLMIATVSCIQCNGQFTNKCLPRPMREVPVTLQIKNVSADFRISACKNGLLANSEFANLAQEQIMNQYQQIFDCKLVSLRHRLCETTGRRTHHVTIYYLANLTCGDKCYHLSLHDGNNIDARTFYSIQVNRLRQAYRTRHQFNFSYNDMLVEVFYFKGRKVDFHFNCDGNIIRQGVSKKIPACRCPSSCADPCQLPPETGRCPRRFLHYYHNTTTRQCQTFVYEGCGGNQNRFTTQDACETACKVCPEGMVYKCGTSCPSTCDRIRRFPCTVQCVQGCFCKEGTVLLEKDGDVCVAPENCPVPEPECPEGMVYQECGTACPTTCDNKDDLLRPCTSKCVQGCFCNESTVLLEEDGNVCVAPENCPVPEPECPEGMVYQECGTACPTTCDNKDDLFQPCTSKCVQGCFCNESTVLLEEDGNVCVAPEECPVTGSGQECPEGMVYDECGCLTTCDNKDDEASSCNMLTCKSGCFCKAGTVLLEAGGENLMCVAKDKCDTGIIAK